jgi:hypothetical protein
MTERVGERRKGMIALGAVVLVGLLVAAGALWYASLWRHDDNVAGFARAPEGCTTTLDFERSGEFVLYVETTGRLDVVRGDCDAPTSYADGDGAFDVGAVEFSMRDADGQEIEAEPGGTSREYDTGAFAGESWGVVQVDQPGRHELTVGPNDAGAFAIAIGGDPDEGVALLRWLAVAAAVSGLVIGGLLVLLGSRRTTIDDGGPSPWQPDGAGGPQALAWPSGPPGFPTPPPTTGATGPAGPPAAPGPPWGPPRRDP